MSGAPPRSDEAGQALERGVALHREGRFAEAAAEYGRVPDEHPRGASARYLQAGAALRSSGLDEARALAHRAAEAAGVAPPSRARDYVTLADGLAAERRYGEAAPLYEIATLLDDAELDAHVGLGLVFAALERPTEAAACFQRALRHDPVYLPALLNLGSIWRRINQRESALVCLRQAVEVAPDRFDAQFLLGTVLCDLRRLDEAIACHRRALALLPDHPGALGDLGSALVLRGDSADGLAALRRAVELAPRWEVAHVNLGVALVRERQLDLAMAEFKIAEELAPDFDYARFCESNLLLLQGDYARGLAMYDAHRVVYPHRYRERRWDGGPLDGRTILLYAQHGLGDTLQFLRYVPLVAARGGRVLVEVQRALLPLCAGQPGADRVCALREVAEDEFDVQATLLELPAIFGHTLDTIPAAVPYLRADPALRAVWAERIGRDKNFKIGIAWHGNAAQKDGLIRSCALADFAPVWRTPGVSVYSLQEGAGSEELTGEVPVASLGALDGARGAFMDTAAIMENLDLVITVDTSIAHLAGGLGRPVWLAAPRWVDWRWMLDRADSPWYPTMRIFRQPRAFDWAPVFAEIATALAIEPRPVRNLISSSF